MSQQETIIIRDARMSFPREGPSFLFWSGRSSHFEQEG